MPMCSSGIIIVTRVVSGDLQSIGPFRTGMAILHKRSRPCRLIRKRSLCKEGLRRSTWLTAKRHRLEKALGPQHGWTI